MSEDEFVDTFYSEERWHNWLERVREEELDPEDEDSARLLLNLQDDAAIAVAKIVAGFEDGWLEEDRAVEEIEGVREIVLTPAEFDDEEKAMLVDGVQTSLVPVFYAAEEYVVAGPADGDDPAEFVRAAAAAEGDDPDAALGYVVQAGTLIFDGAHLDVSVADELEYGLVSEWVNGLDSLQSALADPEVIEE